MNEPDGQERNAEIEASLAQLERRLAKVELVLGMGEYHEEARPQAAKPAAEGELEMAIGQNLFAKVGIVVLAIGGVLTLSLPWREIPVLVPSVAGWAVAGVLFLVAQWLQKPMPLNARYFRGSGMALLFFATLRLCYFADPPLMSPSSAGGAIVLSLAVAVNLAIGWWRKSVFLTGMAMVTGYAAALAVGTPWYVFGVVTALLLLAGFGSRLRGWPWLPIFAIPATFLTYLVWAIGNPVIGHPIEVAAGPFASIWFLLGWMALNALFTLFRRDRDDEVPAQVATVLNCGGYVLFLVHSLIRFGEVFTLANVVASLVLLAVAVMFWTRERSQFATFVYAMTGYGALTMALIKASEIPDLFVWLSAQSLLVVVTAIWFRSRFIIVANFLIYLAVITAYMVMVQGTETGISLVFVWVALTSARILKWRKDRLELKTDMMRNAYLTSAFIVFPYALYHIVPPSWVAVSWVGIAILYYVMNLFTKARKYRWMGHNTLLLTVVYILIMGIGKMEGTQRIVSFLVLGTVLLVVSLVFSVIRARQHKNSGSGKSPPE